MVTDVTQQKAVCDKNINSCAKIEIDIMSSLEHANI